MTNNTESLSVSRNRSRKSSITSKASVYSEATSVPASTHSFTKTVQKWLSRARHVVCYKPRYYGEPFEDRYNDNNQYFLVIASRFGKTQVYRFNKAKSLYIFGYESKVRRLCLQLVTNQYFELFVLLTILVNCIFLAMTNPPEEPEYVFAVIYTLEMIFKIVSRGFAFHKYAYLRDPWNWLDFTVVIMGYITFAPGIGNLSGIRTFRVFRALRTISAIKGLKAMVNTLLMSMKMLGDVMILTLFFLCIFALIGMQLFVGVLRNKCGNPVPVDLTISYRSYASNSSNWKLEGEDNILCGNNTGSRLCPANFSCLSHAGPNPNFGYTNFDHFGWALLTSFQVVTLDFWEDIYNDIIYAMGPWYVIYFGVLIFFGPFYLVNLVLAVVAASYESEVQASKMETEEQREQQKRVRPTYFARRTSIMDIVYGNTDSMLDKNLHKIMYDVPAMREETQSNLDEDASVLQIREEVDSVSPNQALHQNGWARPSAMASAPRASKSEKSFVITSKLEEKPNNESIHAIRFKRFCSRVKTLVKKKYFEGFIVFCILLNTLFMAIESHGMDPVLKKVVLIANIVFTFIFLTEMILKLLAFGLKGYLRSRWNIFDGVVVIISVIDFIVVQAHGTEAKGTSVLRAFRLLRILKLAKSWTTMSSLLATIGKSLGALGNLTVILGIIVYIFAVVGMQLFGKSYTKDKFGGEIPRWNFIDFYHSCLMIFRVLCGEWIEPLWDCMRATGPVAILLYIPAFLIGNFIILNLFLALLLSSFASEAENTKKVKRKTKVLDLMRRTFIVSKFVSRMQRREKVVPEIVVGNDGGEPSSDQDGNDDTTNKSDDSIDNEKESDQQDKTDDNQTSLTSRVCCCTVNIGHYKVDPCLPLFCLRGCMTKCDDTSSTCSLWLIIRYKVKVLVVNKYFEWFVVLLIAASSITLAFEDVNINNNPELKAILYKLNIFFAVVFTLEMLLKFVGLGFVSYFTNPWNWLDFVIVIVSIVTICGNENISFMRSLRTLRALRPLRAVSKFEGMRVVITSLLNAFPGIANVLLVSLMFWLIFSIMGVQSFGGKFYKCLDADGNKFLPSVIANKTVCLAKGQRWVRSNIHFDDSLNGFLALLQVATFEGWMEIMEDAVDSTKVDQQPCRECNFVAYWYFVVFIVLGTFFILNLIIGVIIDNFNQLKQQMDIVGSMDVFLTASQRNWMSALKTAASKKPKKRIKKPQNKFQGALYDLVISRKFEVFIMSVITINMAVMMVQHYDQTKQVETTLEMLNLVFTGIFILEGILRIIALRCGYFISPWNVFDFIIVICSIVGIILENLQEALPISPSLLRIVRVFRVGRLLRFFEAAKGIRRLLFSLIVSLPALINIGAILFLVIFIYAVVGMSLFGYVKKTDPLNDVVNFENFGNSFILLFRIMTAAGWNDILNPLMIQPPDCDPNYKNLQNGNCGYKLTSVLFLSSFIVVIFLILINMYIAIILENYNQVMEQEKIGITNEDIDLFYQQWELYDPNATQFIEFKDLSDFVHQMEGSLRIPKPNKATCALMNIPLVNGTRIHCLDLIQGLVKKVVSHDEDVESEGFNLVMQKMEERFRAAFPSRNKHVSTLTTMEMNRQAAAVKVIVRGIRRYREQKLLAALQEHIHDGRERVNQGFVDEDFNNPLGSDVSVIVVEAQNIPETEPQNNQGKTSGAQVVTSVTRVVTSDGGSLESKISGTPVVTSGTGTVTSSTRVVTSDGDSLESKTSGTRVVTSNGGSVERKASTNSSQSDTDGDRSRSNPLPLPRKQSMIAWGEESGKTAMELQSPIDKKQKDENSNSVS